jgi:hypothetical protein
MLRRRPVLPVNAAAPGGHADEVVDLGQLKPESLWAAPAAWCPNPQRTVSLRVRGDSMAPLILDGYLIAVDTSEYAREKIDWKDRCSVEQENKTISCVASDEIRPHGSAGSGSARESMRFISYRIGVEHRWEGPAVGW